MVSCIQIESASLVFAYLSLIITSIGSFVCIAVMVGLNVLMAYMNSGPEGTVSFEIQDLIETFSLFTNVCLAVILSTLGVSFAFSIILTKGILSKKAHLVKAYFIYGVTKKTIAVLSLIYFFSTEPFNITFGLLSLLGCFLYGLILKMIWKTYLKLSNKDCDQFSHKNLDEVKLIA